MYIESVPNRSSPPAILLRESYREAGKVKKRTLLNLSDWPNERIAGFKALLKGGIVIPKDHDGTVQKAPSTCHGGLAGCSRSAMGIRFIANPCCRFRPRPEMFGSWRLGAAQQ
jgi:hypothetical protein